MTSTHKAPKPCHNCRRQRHRCDRTLPRCNKCAATNRDCLGYGQLFRWTDSVASRGRLAGQASTHALTTTTTQGQGKRPKPAYILMGQGERPHAKTYLLESDHDGLVQEVNSIASLSCHSASPLRDTQVTATAAPWALTDPLWQDMTNSYRFYLSYFTTRLCRDLVALDNPNWNPFRDLLPLTRTSPLLQHILVANAAAHMSNLINQVPASSSSSSSPSSSSTASALSPWDGPIPSRDICPRRGTASSDMMRDALIAKHHALQLMHRTLQDMQQQSECDRDVVFAAAYLFINVELIESGKDGWRAHLEGACQIIHLLHRTKSSNEALRDYMLSDCSVYLIFASAFLPSTSQYVSYFSPTEIRDMLDRASANSYICCPSQVLQILYIASQLSTVVPLDDHSSTAGCSSARRVAEQAAALIDRAQTVDMRTWADSMHSCPEFASSHPQQIIGRMHVGAAHTIATCLYILQAVPSVVELGIVESDLEEKLSQELVDHLAAIPEDDANFKAATWPTFILGAGAVHHERRRWVMNRMRMLILQVPWGFLYTAMDTLQVLWGLDEVEDVADSSSQGGPDALRDGKTQKAQAKRRSWVQTLRDPDLNFLIV